MTEPNNSVSMQAVAEQIRATQAALQSAIAATRKRNTVSLSISLVLMVLMAGYMVYFHNRFANEVTPANAANYVHINVAEQLPAAQAQLEAAIRQNTPVLLDQAEAKIMTLPDDMADSLEKRLREQTQEQIPVMENQLYDVISVALAKAPAAATAANGDVGRYTALLDSAAELYKARTMQMADDLYNKYQASAGDFITELNALADNHGLTVKQRHEREMFRDFLIMTRAYQQKDGEALIPELIGGPTQEAPPADSKAPKPQ